MHNSSFLNTIDKDWTLFLDRDGVINKRIFGGYVKNISEFEFIAGVPESIRTLSNIFKRIIIITNQQGVGKGIMTEGELRIVHDHLIESIQQIGGRIDKIYYCTDLSEKHDNCRKPKIIIAQQAKMEFPNIDLSKSVMIGDSLSDIEFGRNAGMKTVYVTSSEMNKKAIELADISCDNLIDFTNQILKYEA